MDPQAVFRAASKHLAERIADQMMKKLCDGDQAVYLVDTLGSTIGLCERDDFAVVIEKELNDWFNKKLTGGKGDA